MFFNHILKVPCHEDIHENETNTVLLNFLVYLFRYEIFSSVKIYIVVFWVMTLCTAADEKVCLNSILTKIIFVTKQTY